MKVFFLSVLIFFFACFTIDRASAQSKKNLHFAKVSTFSGKTARGILYSADGKGLYLVRRIGDSSVFVSSAQIREIRLRRNAKTNTGTTIGFLTGLAAGTGAAVALNSDDRLQNTLNVVGAVLLTFTTTAIAGAISSRPDEVIQINGRTEDYLQTLNRIKTFTPRLNP
jgi:hypothetical protein